MGLKRRVRVLVALAYAGSALFVGCGTPNRTFGTVGTGGTAGADAIIAGGAGTGVIAGSGGAVHGGGAGVSVGDAGDGGAAPVSDAGAGQTEAGAGGEAPVLPCKGANLDTDPKNCGTCGHDCAGLPNLAADPQGITCKAGACVIPDSACVAGKKHCSIKPDDTCEADVTTSTQCGSCGNKCDAAQICSSGSCADTCAAGSTKCTSGQSVGCYALASSTDHCGNCATTCPAPPSNGNALCTTGSCKVQCSSGFHQCNASAECEADSDVNHCGPTCKQCETSDPHAVPTCSSNTCSYPCGAGYQFCGFCISKNDPANCGSCGNNCGSSKSCVNGSCVDNLPPTIVSITPADGVTKLTPATDSIVITFSEPMKKDVTQAAFSANSGTPVPTWNAAGTELTIDPKIAYPTGTDPAAAATPYKYTLSTGAKDLAGNSIAAAVSRQLSLLREITQQCPYAYGSHLSAGDTGPSLGAGTFIGAGDHGLRGFMSFDISSLPSAIQTFESATIGSQIVQIDGNPFAVLGNYLIYSVAFSAINAAAYNAPMRIDLGTFVAANGANAVGDNIVKDVLPAMISDYANRIALGNQTQYRIFFNTPANADNTKRQVWIYTGDTVPTLTVKYLVP